MENDIWKVIRKYKLDHIFFWFSYFMFLWIVYGHEEDYGFISLLLGLCFVLNHIFASYFIIYYLFPKTLYKKKYLKFGIYLVISEVFFSVLIGLANYLIYINYLPHHVDIEFQIDNIVESYFFSTVMITMVVMMVKLSKNWIIQERQKPLIEKEKITAELKFLKAQINPHFLFNGINNIYHLIDINKETAKSTLLKLSELLRYQLYECKNEYVNLSDEVTFIDNYIEIEKLRKEKELNVIYNTNEIENYNTNEIENELQIAPFILIPYVENAFKHVSNNSYPAKNYININLDINNNRLLFNVKNSKEELKNTKTNIIGGIGLENVKRRLELLYAEKYKLEIKDKHDYFDIKLQIKL